MSFFSSRVSKYANQFVHQRICSAPDLTKSGILVASEMRGGCVPSEPAWTWASVWGIIWWAWWAHWEVSDGLAVAAGSRLIRRTEHNHVSVLSFPAPGRPPTTAPYIYRQCGALWWIYGEVEIHLLTRGILQGSAQIEITGLLIPCCLNEPGVCSPDRVSYRLPLTDLFCFMFTCHFSAFCRAFGCTFRLFTLSPSVSFYLHSPSFPLPFVILTVKNDSQPGLSRMVYPS